MNNIKQIDVSGHRYDICDANMRAAVTDEYDVLTAYTMGDFCIFNNVLYRCLEDTTGAWQEEKWEKKTLAEMYKEMEIMTHISDAFSALKKYTAGKYCIYENTLYRFTGTKEAGEWDPAKVVATSVDAEIGALNENIAKKQDASTAITTGNIGQQSVNYAATAGSATTAESATTASTANVVAWGGVSGKPSVYPPSSHNHDDRYYAISSGNGVLNTEYLNSGECYWRKMGRVCYVYAEFIPKKQFEDLCLLFSGLPGAAMDQNFFYPAIQADDTVRNGLLRIMTNGEIHEFYYFKTAMGKKTKVGFMYITA